LRPIEEQGYVCVAVNTDTADYVSMAQRLFASLKSWHPAARTCLITDQIVSAPEFDHVRLIDPAATAYANDAAVFRHTPFRETIKLEADMLIVSAIDHWWNMLRHRDLVISTGCRDWHDQLVTNSPYRRCFRENHLPDVYNAVTYWRLSATAKEFFDLVRQIFQTWPQVKQLLRFAEDQASTDLVYAIAAAVMGPERVTMPFASYPQIVHMKPRTAGTVGPWSKNLVWEHDNGRLRIDTVVQWGAFHYHEKNWLP
jgi:hypothetical protein